MPDPFGHFDVVPGVRITFFVPIEGDAPLFHVQPSSHHLSPPLGRVTDKSEVALSEEFRGDIFNAQTATQAYEQMVAKIRDYLKTLASDCEQLKQDLRQTARRLIEARQAQIRRDDDFDKGMRIPRRA